MRTLSKALLALTLALAPLSAEAGKDSVVRQGTGITGLPGDIYDRIVLAAIAQGEKPTLVPYQGTQAVFVPADDAMGADLYYLVAGGEIVVVTVAHNKKVQHGFHQEYARYVLAQAGITSGLAATAPLPQVPVAAANEPAPAAAAAATQQRIAYVSTWSSDSFAKADQTFYELKVEVESRSYMGAELPVGVTVLGYRATPGTGGYEPCPADSCAVTTLLDRYAQTKKIVGYETNLGVIRLYFPVP
jgi:hypothetical protein